ncbi:MAG: SoxR reducing system RseC family protein [Candidatus Thiodiazotropha sp. (ex Dulcina madagascariensis)]|nr:SoxR reducing system RseC family protein [Candidatus Thiodiazotropha sp. (ex Dulcina madagascariensis)]MCU7926302.1 SoxR reducing system RseC family protein [Candidatus Thiodiazotropha sp. (ex Dulcina madagascariensis)]
MIEEPATVVSLDEEYAVVVTEQRAACGSCQRADGCSTTVLAGLFKRRHNPLKVLNPIQAKPGERVIIGLREQALLKVSVLAYLLPLVCMIMAAILMQWLAARFAWQVGELPPVVGGLLGLIAGLLLLRRLAGRKSGDPGYQVVILRQADATPVQLV